MLPKYEIIQDSYIIYIIALSVTGLTGRLLRFHGEMIQWIIELCKDITGIGDN